MDLGGSGNHHQAADSAAGLPPPMRRIYLNLIDGGMDFSYECRALAACEIALLVWMQLRASGADTYPSICMEHNLGYQVINKIDLPGAT